jgi:hypothetical protein
MIAPSIVRHPERSEEENLLFEGRLRPSAVEGPNYAHGLIGATQRRLSAQGQSAVSSHKNPLLIPSISNPPHRSFDFGSATYNGQIRFSLASVQDDGIFLWVSPVVRPRFAQDDGVLNRTYMGCGCLARVSAQDDGTFKGNGTMK